MPAPSTATRLAGRGGWPAGRLAAGVDGVQVEPERRDHVLGDLAADQVGQVAGLDPQRGVEVHLAALDGRRQDVVRGRHRRALELLAQGGGKGRQHRRERRVGRGAAGDLVALAVPGLGRLRVGLDPAPGGGQQLLGVAGQLVDDAGLDRLGGAEPLALEQQLGQGVGDAEHPDGPGHAAAAGQQAEGHLGQAELGIFWRGGPARSGGGRPARSRSPPPSAVPFSAATTGRGVGLQPAQLGLGRSTAAKNSAAVSSVTPLSSRRSPPAKKVSLAEVRITPVTPSCSA